MPWAFLTLALVLPVGAYLLVTVRRIAGCRDELNYYRLSVRFWLALAAVGVAVVSLFFTQLWDHPRIHSEVGRLTLALLSILPTVVIAAGVVNAASLWRALRRRGRALKAGRTFEGHVTGRRRGLAAHDLMVVDVELELPDERGSDELTYRARDPHPTRRVRVSETCSADHWDRFENGRPVKVVVDPEHPRDFAVALF